MQFDDVLIQIGQFGKYQRIQYFLLCIPAICGAFHQFASIFISGEPKFRCALPVELGYGSNDTYALQGAQHNLSVIANIPMVEADGQMEYSKCQLYQYQLNETNGHTIGVTEINCPSGYVYDQTVFRTTVVSEFNLVCDDIIKKTTGTSVYMFGVLVGAFVFGILSDAIGRKKTLLICIVLQGVAGISCAFAPEYYSFISLRFIIGATSMGLFMTCFVLGIELIGPSHRLFAGIVIEYFFALGFIILTGIAYLLREWKWIQLTISCPSFFFLIYIWLVPESARWLLAKGRTTEAEQIIQHAANVNKASLPEKIFDSPSAGDEKLSDLTDTRHKELSALEKLKEVINAKTLLLRTAVIFFNWFVVAMGYYGLSLNSGNLPGDVYVTTLMGALVEIPAYTLCFICNKTGRKIPHVICMVLGGLACLTTVAADLAIKDTGLLSKESYNNLLVGLNMTGKFGVTVGFAIIYFWSAEIYPTALRNSLMGFSSTVARVGSILAPYIADIGDFVPLQYKVVLPAAIFGSLLCIGGLSAIFLPETTGHELPETVREANLFPHHKQFDPNKSSVNLISQSESKL